MTAFQSLVATSRTKNCARRWAHNIFPEVLRNLSKRKSKPFLGWRFFSCCIISKTRSFTVAEVAIELGFEKEDVNGQLTALETIGVVVVESNPDKHKYRYHPVNEALRSMVDQLAVGYSKQRVPILSVILAEHPDRPRLFAEAFRIISRKRLNMKDAREH
jgi:hypothetical protein